MRVKCYGKSLPQQDRTVNEDAFSIIREPIPVAVVSDGAGNAEQAARRVVRLFELFVREATPETILLPTTWTGWVKKLDSALLGGCESTFLAAAVVGFTLVGVSAGDSQAYLLGAEGGFKYLTTAPQKARLGSGNAQPFTFTAVLKPRDVALLMTDGAWTPISPYVTEKALHGVFLQHFSEVPSAMITAASRTGRWDDMAVVALRLIGA
jgi:hypothetical protein